MKIKLNLNKSVAQNAQDYFEKAKKARKKLKGALKALEEAKTQLEHARIESEETINAHKQQAVKTKRKKHWFEKFRWFHTSQGHLVIGGRDATTNEIVIKKHLEEGDLVFHTDMAGSPFFVLKLGGDKATPQEIQEVANATLTFSRAFKLGLTTANVFWVTPSQVSKEAQAGEYMAKGAFMIRGKTNYVPCQIDCAIGKCGELLECAPRHALEGRCNQIITIVQGKKRPSEIAKIIKKKLGGDLDDIIRILPSGGMDIR
ncbi:DUF814 domain-containing protein [Candidatus Woesearchaeota archaeon]|nr:MAG: DUF814 domain-containing protein [Candidatus Woesearchaeota archaeon]